MNRLSLLFLFLLAVSCRNTPEESKPEFRRSREEMADINRHLVEKDRERIINYIERNNLKMQESPTGLWYSVTVSGEGKEFVTGDRVRFAYDCRLLDGTRCYSSSESGPREIIIGKTQAETGLIEGFMLLRPGAEALFILPPHLAYGLIGDGKKIPSRAILVYNVAILQP
ncbi:MAG: FKBP-type peptidyl-prolyl cis-trans isomerase [Bacteroidales bacterium]|jgi:FKBP-type peptidyl-prolyl cis-trans isomerase|nr:FKBP-type peptidyl-prolyl cis-trans isomerase [Bacteroidales bacterium]MCU0408069.1 FKBP-type peptidyl-prolyl cis-trans isomerase [Bacteroidales bacterium]